SRRRARTSWRRNWRSDRRWAAAPRRSGSAWTDPAPFAPASAPRKPAPSRRTRSRLSSRNVSSKFPAKADIPARFLCLIEYISIRIYRVQRFEFAIERVLKLSLRPLRFDRGQVLSNSAVNPVGERDMNRVLTILAIGAAVGAATAPSLSPAQAAEMSRARAACAALGLNPHEAPFFDCVQSLEASMPTRP